MECLNCKIDVPQTPKKRPKLYCSERCRVEFFRKKKPKGQPGRPRKANVPETKFEKNLEKGIVKKGTIEDLVILGQAISKVSGNTIERIDPNLDERAPILKEIAYIKEEKIPKERDTPNGRKSWAFDQKKRIQELEKQLND